MAENMGQPSRRPAQAVALELADELTRALEEEYGERCALAFVAELPAGLVYASNTTGEKAVAMMAAAARRVARGGYDPATSAPDASATVRSSDNMGAEGVGADGERERAHGGGGDASAPNTGTARGGPGAPAGAGGGESR